MGDDFEDDFFVRGLGIYEVPIERANDTLNDVNYDLLEVAVNYALLEVDPDGHEEDPVVYCTSCDAGSAHDHDGTPCCGWEFCCPDGGRPCQ